MHNYLFLACSILVLQHLALEAGATRFNFRKTEGHVCWTGTRGHLVKFLCPGSCFVEFKFDGDVYFGCYMRNYRTGWYKPAMSFDLIYRCNSDYCNNEDVKPQRQSRD